MFVFPISLIKASILIIPSQITGILNMLAAIVKKKENIEFSDSLKITHENQTTEWKIQITSVDRQIIICL